MTAAVETMAYVRDVPWHGVGTKVEGLMTSGEALEQGGVNWLVQKEPMYLVDGTIVGNRWANVRQSDRSTLGIVGDVYQNIQNHDAFTFGDNIVDDGQGHWETVGSLMGGRKVFASMELPGGVRVPGDDGEMKPYLLITNGFDGLTLLRADVVMVRVVCHNTWTLALDSAIRTFKIKHSGTVEGKIEAARKALEVTFTYEAVFAKEAAALVGKTLVESQVEDILRAAFPVPESLDTPARIDHSDFAKALAVYRAEDNLDAVRGTAWGVLQAVGAYLDHEVKYFGRTFDAASVKADSILYDGPAARKKQKVFDLVRAI